MKKLSIVWGLFLGCISFHSQAQLVITQNNVALQLAQVLAGPGITVSAATLTAASPTMTATFTSTGTNLGIAGGVLLCTGPATQAVGPNISGSTGQGMGGAGLPQLNALASAPTFDAVRLSFDFVPLSSTISFRYVFGSEEWLEYVNTGFNDAFAFYISGPGIAGQQNLAVVPGTATPITINTINTGSNSVYYNNNAGGATIEFDGLTTVMTATNTANVTVTPCLTYRLDLMIADGGDGVWDSGIFLEQGSLTSGQVTVSTSAAPVGGGVASLPDSISWEGCNNATVTFTLNQTAATPTVINYTVGGTATSGVDYTALPTSVTVPAGQLSTSITLVPLSDGITEGVETVTLNVGTSTCSTAVNTLYINDIIPPTISVSPDTSYCIGGGPVVLRAEGLGSSGFFTYNWGAAAPPTYTWDTLVVNPGATSVYNVTATDFFCTSNTASDQITVTINPLPVPNAGPDASFCAGSSLTLTASGGQRYQWYTVPGGTLIGNATNPITVSPVGTVSYGVLVANGSCENRDTLTLTELVSPVANAGSDVSICTGDNTVLTGSGGSVYSWWPALGLSSTNSSVTTASPTDTTVYYLEVIDVNGCVDTDSVSVIVWPLPIINAGVDQAICFGTTANLAASGATSYVWSPGNGLSSTTLANVVFDSTDTETFIVTGTDINGCSSTDQVTVTVNPLPIPNAGPDASYCAGSSLTLTASGGINYQWFTVANSSPVGIGTNPIVVSPVGQVLYGVIVDDGTCTNNDTVQLTELALPIADAGPNVSICIGDDTTLTGSGGTLYSWWPAFGLSSTSTDVTTAAPNDTTMYYLEVTDANGCVDTDSVVVLVWPLPIINAGVDQSICFGTTANLVASGGASYVWSPGNGLSSTTLANVVFDSTDTQGFTVTGTDVNGCVNTDQVTVIVVPLPIADFTLPLEACVTDVFTATFTGVGSNQAIGTWNFGTLSQTGGTNLGPISITSTQSGIQEVILTIQEGNCISLPDTESITIHPFPVSDAGNDISFCSTQTGIIGTATTAGYTYSWTPTTGLSSSVGSNPDVTLTNLGSTNQTSTYVVSTTANGCTTSDSVNVLVYPIPVADFTAPAAQCFTGNSYDFVAEGVYGNGATFAWSFGVNGLPTVSTDTNPSGVSFNASGTQTVTLTITENGCVSPAATDTVVVFQMPAADFTVVDDEGCIPFTAVFRDMTITNDAILTYDWNFYEQDGATSGQRDPSYTYTIPGTYDVYLVVQTVNGCRDSILKSQFVSARPLPFAGFTISDNPVDVLNTGVYISDNSVGAISCQYTMPDGSFKDSCEFGVSYADTGVYCFLQLVTNEYGCTDSTSRCLIVRPAYTFYIPNAFTPNGRDGNEIFTPKSVGIAEYEMRIYNRWGQQVFRTKSLDNGWDGNVEGQEAQLEVYTYDIDIIDFDGIYHHYVGKVTLCR